MSGRVLHLPTEKQLKREDQFKPVWTHKGRTQMVFAFNTTVDMTFTISLLSAVRAFHVCQK